MIGGTRYFMCFTCRNNQSEGIGSRHFDHHRLAEEATRDAAKITTCRRLEGAAEPFCASGSDLRVGRTGSRRYCPTALLDDRSPVP